MVFVKAFIVGGLFCVLGQILMDNTKLMPARILVIFVCLGVVLGGLGLYKPIIEFAGAGATVPLPGFGHVLAEGVIKDVEEIGLLGVFTGGLKAAAGGLTSAIFFGYFASILFNPKAK